MGGYLPNFAHELVAQVGLPPPCAVPHTSGSLVPGGEGRSVCPRRGNPRPRSSGRWTLGVLGVKGVTLARYGPAVPTQARSW